jgi:hypothetical protein
MGLPDPALLDWAAGSGRILLTHDLRTIPNHAYSRIAQGLPMPGVIQVHRTLPVAAVIEQVLLIDACSRSAEWEGQVVYLPLR